MGIHSASSVRLLVTTLLVASVSVCCCQVHLVASILESGDSPPTACSGAERSGAGGSCCHKPGAEPGDSGRPAEDPPRSRCGRICCVKWTGTPVAKVVALDLQPLDLVLPAPNVSPPPAAPRPVSTPERWSIGPPTLVRLHCALLI